MTNQPDRVLPKALIMLIALSAAFALSCSTPVPKTDRQLYQSTGVIISLDPTGAKITLDHQDIPGFMSAMTMDFAASGPDALNGYKIGDVVSFELERSGGNVTITKLTKTGEVAVGS